MASQRVEGAHKSRESLNLKELREINRCRMGIGPPEITIVERKCLRCGKRFLSLGHFRCTHCRYYAYEKGMVGE